MMRQTTKIRTLVTQIHRQKPGGSFGGRFLLVLAATLLLEKHSQ
jgi:hypothetical protein